MDRTAVKIGLAICAVGIAAAFAGIMLSIWTSPASVAAKIGLSGVAIFLAGVVITVQSMETP